MAESLETIPQVVHTIRMGDVEDPDLMVADPIFKWQETDSGKWVMENSLPGPEWHRRADPASWGHQYKIVAYFTPQQLTYWKLKYE
jgi:hypothetical protein